MAAEGTVLWKCGACEECFYELTELAGHKCIGNTGTITLSEQCIKQLDQQTFATADIENTSDQVEQAISAIAALEEEEEEQENGVASFEHAVDHSTTVAFTTTVGSKRSPKSKPTIVSVINPDRKFKKHQKGKRSLVWAYFTALDCKKAMCCICEKVIAYCGTPTNLVYHLNRFHPNESEVVKSKHAGGAKYQYLESKIPKSTAYGRLKSKSGSLKVAKRPIVSTVSAQRKSLSDRILEFLATDLLPVHTVDGKGFKKFLQSIDPTAKIPDSKSILKELMPRRYYAESKRIKQLLSCCSKLQVSLELWTGSNEEYYLTVSSHFMTDDFEQKCYVLRTSCLGSDCKPQAIATALLSTVSDWDITHSVLCIVSDGSETIGKAISELQNTKNKHITCLAHTLDRIIKESFAASLELSKLIDRCRFLVRFLKQGHAAKQKLIEIQTQDKHLQSIMRDHLDFADAKTPNCPLKPIKDVPGCWITLFHMLQRIFTLRNVINIVVDDTNAVNHSFSETDWLAIEETISLFKAFEVVTLELCSERYPSLSKVIPIVQGLLSLVNNCNSLTLEFVEKVRKDLLSKLRRRLGQVENNLSMAVATILDPRFKNIAFQSDLAVDAAIQSVTAEGREYRKMDHQYSDLGCKEVFDKNSSYTDSLWESFDKKATPRKEQSISADIVNTEIKNYFEEPLIDRKKEPAAWWRDYGSTRYPILAEIAKKVLSTPSTSVPPERIFLQREKPYLERRKMIKSKYVDQFVFLSMNVE